MFFVVVLYKLAFALKEASCLRDLDSSYTVSCVCTGLGTSETIARILQPYNIRVAHKPITTLRRLLTNVKDKDKTEDRQGAVYNIKRAKASDTVKKCLDIFSGIGASVKEFDIDTAHRVPTRRQNSRGGATGSSQPIICKFTRCIAKEAVMAKRKETG